MIGFGLGVAAILFLFLLIVSVRHRWGAGWPPLLLTASFVTAVLGLIFAVPPAMQRERRRAFALCAIAVSTLCLFAQLGVCVLYVLIGNAG